jgi:L-seryl-tRNA(Ser) seleniumtransferase
MATKPLDFLNRIPSVSELLEKQPVRALTNRWNRSVVASGVRSFLDELRTDLRRRAAEVPTIRELAERAAQYVVSQQQSAPKTCINATGRIIGGPWAGVPLADIALQRAVVTGRDFVLSSHAADQGTSNVASEIGSLACGLTGAQAAVAVHSYAGALWLALATLAAHREVLISRAEVGEIDAAGPLPKLAASAEAVLRDVGTANRTTAADYEVAASPRASVLLKLSSDEYRIMGDTVAPRMAELVALARDRELVLVAAMAASPLVDPPASIQWPDRSVRALLSAGVDLVLVRGDGLLGGPPCGLVIGRQDVVERIAANPLFGAWRLDALRGAALVGTLQCYERLSESQHALPLWQLLTTPVENLQNRAERIAPQLAQAAGVASACAVETRSPLIAAMGEGRDWPSYAVALTATDAKTHDLEMRLKTADQPVLGRIEDGRLLLDLRTVFPRQDTALVASIAGETSAAAGVDQDASPAS